MLDFANILDWFTLAGIIVFAASGALLGMRKRIDIIGVMFIAAITGIGGGTLRDVLLGDTPVSWVREPLLLAVCIAVGAVLCLFHRAFAGRQMRWLLYADAVGLALFAVLGASKALDQGAHPLVAILFGAISATFGGVIRDVILLEPPVLTQREIYVTCALLSAAVFVLIPASWGFELRAMLGLVAGLSLRLPAIRYGWPMPFPNYDAP